MNRSKVRYTQKDSYITYDNHHNLVNYIIIAISVLAITLTGIAYSFSLNANAEEELSSIPEPPVSASEESDII